VITKIYLARAALQPMFFLKNPWRLDHTIRWEQRKGGLINDRVGTVAELARVWKHYRCPFASICPKSGDFGYSPRC